MARLNKAVTAGMVFSNEYAQLTSSFHSHMGTFKYGNGMYAAIRNSVGVQILSVPDRIPIYTHAVANVQAYTGVYWDGAFYFPWLNGTSIEIGRINMSDGSFSDVAASGSSSSTWPYPSAINPNTHDLYFGALQGIGPTGGVIIHSYNIVGDSIATLKATDYTPIKRIFGLPEPMGIFNNNLYLQVASEGSYEAGGTYYNIKINMATGGITEIQSTTSYVRHSANGLKTYISGDAFLTTIHSPEEDDTWDVPDVRATRAYVYCITNTDPFYIIDILTSGGVNYLNVVELSSGGVVTDLGTICSVSAGFAGENGYSFVGVPDGTVPPGSMYSLQQYHSFGVNYNMSEVS